VTGGGWKETWIFIITLAVLFGSSLYVGFYVVPVVGAILLGAVIILVFLRWLLLTSSIDNPTIGTKQSPGLVDISTNSSKDGEPDGGQIEEGLIGHHAFRDWHVGPIGVLLWLIVFGGISIVLYLSR